MPTHTPSKVSIAISISSTYYNISIIQTGKRLSISILQTKHTHPNQFTTNLSQANPTQPYPSIPNPPVLRPLHPKLRNRHARSLARTRSSKEKTRQRECRNPSAVPGFPSPAFCCLSTLSVGNKRRVQQKLRHRLPSLSKGLSTRNN